MSGYFRAPWLISLGLLLAAPAANAFCFGPADLRIVRLEQLADQDPHAAILAAQEALTAVAGRASCESTLRNMASDRTKLQQELDLSREREHRQGERNAVLLIAGGTFLVLLMYIAIASLRHRDAMELLANRDVLTGLSNRRSIVDCAAAMLATSRETDTSLTLCLLDLDRFKTINDDYGHAAGDAALQAFARILTQAMPANGAVGRWGGEEFLIVLPDTISATAQLIERLRQAALQIHLPFAPYLRIRFSAGLAARHGSEQILDEMIANADRALYGAKREGRDTTRIAV